MRPAQILFQNAKKPGRMSQFAKSVPVEVYPLFAVMFFVSGYAVYHCGKKLTSGELRTQRQGKQASH